MKALGIDIGTTTISFVVVDGQSREMIKSYTIANPGFLETGVPWEKIQDPAMIMHKVIHLLNDILCEYKDIGVIGLTGQMHGIVYVDSYGKHVSPLYTWQDERGNQKCQKGRNCCEIIEEISKTKIYSGYGLVTHYYNNIMGQMSTTAVGLCTIADYLGMVLTGRTKPLMHSSNAASLGLFDVKNNRFIEEVFRKLNLNVQILPNVTEDFQIIGTYRDIPVCVAIGDNQSSFLGAVKNVREDILVNMGTGGQVSVYSEHYYIAEEIETRPFIRGGYILSGSSLCGGRAYAILEQFFEKCAIALGEKEKDIYGMMACFLEEASAKSVSPEKEKLIIDTRFSGTREQPELRGAIRNIGIDNFTPEDLTVGFLKGMADELYQMYLKMGKEAADGKKRIIASGNGLRRNNYLQNIVSQQFHMSLCLAVQQEEAAYGAALEGLIGAGMIDVREAIGMADTT